MSKTFNIESYGEKYTCAFDVAKYSNNGNTAIRILYYDKDFDCYMPYATLTVNFKKLPENMVYLDTNNCPWAEDIVEELNLGEPTDCFEFSGFCVYPQYRLNIDKIKEYEAK